MAWTAGTVWSTALESSFEEWKQGYIGTKEAAQILLNLPLRNGNGTVSSGATIRMTLLNLPLRNGNWWATRSTGATRTLLNLPLRNGNIQLQGHREHAPRLLNLPLRNGNGAIDGLPPDLLYALESSFEEWKRHPQARPARVGVRLLNLPLRNGNC